MLNVCYLSYLGGYVVFILAAILRRHLRTLYNKKGKIISINNSSDEF